VGTTNFATSIRRVAVLGILLGMSTISSLGAEEIKLNVMTYNIMVELSKVEGIPPWKKRREANLELLKKHDLDLIAIQEPTPRQLESIISGLPEYGCVQDEKFTDAAILYRTELFEVVEKGQWWLSPTPEKAMSKGFGNFLPRILVWARLKHRPTDREFIVASTHFDNSLPSQVKMAKLCQEQFKPLIAKNLPMIWMGDFNTDQERGDYPTLVSNGWRDAYLASPKASKDGRDDNVGTFPGHTRRIDHIFLHGPIKATSWQTLPWKEGEMALSDHYPVMAQLIITDG
jgi:endonuclease/exonuclease/phosphatase family metal-dependent hydrolase